MKKITTPTLIEGSLFLDHRGTVSFVNEFSFSDIKRFYIVQNAKKHMVRAWHGHRKEAKYVLCIAGKVRVCAVALPEDASAPVSLDQTDLYSFILDVDKPRILFIPAGFANGFQSLTDDAKLMFFSTSTLEESKNDDVRFPPKHWNVWGKVRDELLTT